MPVTMSESPRQERREAAGVAFVGTLESIQKGTFAAPNFAVLHARNDVDTLAFLSDATRIKAYLTGDHLSQTSALQPPDPQLQVAYVVGYWITLYSQALGTNKKEKQQLI